MRANLIMPVNKRLLAMQPQDAGSESRRMLLQGETSTTSGVPLARWACRKLWRSRISAMRTDPQCGLRNVRSPQPALDQGRVGQHPAVQGGVVDLEAALEEQLLNVAVAERVAQIPRDGLQDQRRLEVPALEVVLGSALEPLDKGVQDHAPPPV